LNAVVELLRRRLARGGRPPFDDGARIALCVEGGAMRGVISAGMVSALEVLGYTRAFDAVYGSSAGAINAAYFLAGQARLGTTIYSENINNRRFIDLSGPLRGKPIVDLGYLLDDVATRAKPLDVARVLASQTPLTVMATDVRTAERVSLRDFSTSRPLLGALRAGATMPIVAGDPIEWCGGSYFDASLTEPIPVPQAEADGCTHVLVLLTRPHESPRVVTPLDRWWVLPRLRRISPALAAKFVDRGAPYRALLDCIAAGRGPASRAIVYGLRPGPPAISKLERGRERLLAGAAAGYNAVAAVLAPTAAGAATPR
jgi:predicted patatin/cPLA2 family phospholipase